MEMWTEKREKMIGDFESFEVKLVQKYHCLWFDDNFTETDSASVAVWQSIFDFELQNFDILLQISFSNEGKGIQFGNGMKAV